MAESTADLEVLMADNIDNNAAQALSFTKAIVADLEAMAKFYQSVFGLKEVMRVQEDLAGEPIDEIILSPSGEMTPSSFILLRFVERQPPAASDSILGFITADLPALLQRVRAAGGQVAQEPRTMAHLGIEVGFAKDPEGRLLELVQML
jgi:predicted enzyme related to lactoylglutathione lyase